MVSVEFRDYGVTSLLSLSEALSVKVHAYWPAWYDEVPRGKLTKLITSATIGSPGA